MNKSLTKSPTEAYLNIPIKKAVSRFVEGANHPSTQPVTLDSPIEKDPRNTPNQITNDSLNESNRIISKKLEVLFNEEQPEMYQTVGVDGLLRHLQPTPTRSPQNNNSFQTSKVVRRKKGHTQSYTQGDLESIKSKDIAKVALAKLFQKDVKTKVITQANKNQTQEISTTGINKSSSAKKMKHSIDAFKINTTSVDPAKRAKLRKMHQAYSDVHNKTTVDQHRVKLNKSPTHSTFSRTYQLSPSPERPIQEIMPISVTHSNQKFKPLSMLTPATTTTSNFNPSQVLYEPSELLVKPKKKKITHQKTKSIGNSLSQSRSQITEQHNISSLQTAGSQNHSLIRNKATKHKRVISSGAELNNILGQSLNHSNYNSSQPIKNPILPIDGIFTQKNTMETANSCERVQRKSVESRIKDSYQSNNIIHEPYQSGNMNEAYQSTITNQDGRTESLVSLKNAFQNALDGYEKDIQSAAQHLDGLQKIKSAYEDYMSQIVPSEQQSKPVTEPGTKNHDELKVEYNRVLSENQQLKENLDKMKTENERLSQMVQRLTRTSNTTHSHSQSHHQSPSQTQSHSNLSTEKKTNFNHIESFTESPPVTKHYHTSEKHRQETENLKTIVMKQQGKINALMNQEAKMMRLLMAVKKNGLDIEKIYNEEVRGKFEQSPADEYNIPTFEKNKPRQKRDSQDEKNLLETLIREEQTPSTRSINSDGTSTEFKGFRSGKSTSDSTPFPTSSHSNLNPLLKNKLKLDFSNIRNKKKNTPGLSKAEEVAKNINDIPPQMETLAIQNQEILEEQQPSEEQSKENSYLGFHDEFMARIDEFSLSWRQAAMNERKF